jgi:cyclophilin family peptidyl-prolyl cis-trans isomerase
MPQQAAVGRMQNRSTPFPTPPFEGGSTFRSPDVTHPLISRRTVGAAALAALLPLSAAAETLPAATAMVRMHTTHGAIDVELYGAHAAGTVNNFMSYLRSGAYTGTAFHRSVKNFVIQAGYIAWPTTAASADFVPVQAPIVNEYSAARPNVRGTIAMAKVGGNPNSATSQWFFNLADNTTVLGPAQNGGFTVFGKATPPSLAVIDKIAALPIANAGGAFAEIPVVNYTSGPILRSNMALVERIEELPARTSLGATERVFNYLEAAYPQYAPPGGAVSGVALGYTYRYYAATGAYVGTKDGMVHYLVPALSTDIHSLGTLADWLGIAEVNGY